MLLGIFTSAIKVQWTTTTTTARVREREKPQSIIYSGGDVGRAVEEGEDLNPQMGLHFRQDYNNIVGLLTLWAAATVVPVVSKLNSLNEIFGAHFTLSLSKDT